MGLYSRGPSPQGLLGSLSGRSFLVSRQQRVCGVGSSGQAGFGPGRGSAPCPGIGRLGGTLVDETGNWLTESSTIPCSALCSLQPGIYPAFCGFLDRNNPLFIPMWFGSPNPRFSLMGLSKKGCQGFSVATAICASDGTGGRRTIQARWRNPASIPGAG